MTSQLVGRVAIFRNSSAEGRNEFHSCFLTMGVEQRAYIGNSSSNDNDNNQNSVSAVSGGGLAKDVIGSQRRGS